MDIFHQPLKIQFLDSFVRALEVPIGGRITTSFPIFQDAMFYHYETKFGTFWICPDPDVSGQFRLYIGRTWIGSYFSPESAAEDVYTKTTGFDEWDLQDDIVLEPRDLSQWKPGKPDV